MFRYRLHTADGDDLGEATYALMIQPGEEILVGTGRRFRVLDVGRGCALGRRALQREAFGSPHAGVAPPAGSTDVGGPFGVHVSMMPPRTRFLRRGDRIELLRVQSFGPTPRPHPGDRGIVQSIDGDGGVRVKWDSGAQASVDPSAGDRFRFLETV